MRADWKPFSAAMYIAAAQTAVFPLPTSPERSRVMGTSAFIMSEAISPTDLFCAFVSGKPSFGRNSDRSPFLIAGGVPLRLRFLVSDSPREKMYASSAAKYLLASPISLSFPEQCISRYAVYASGSPRRFLNSSGSVSGIPHFSIIERASETASEIILCVSPAAEG